MKLSNWCNKVIEYSFYLLFFLVPLAFTGDTSELFEFNKLWVTFIITIVVGAAWITKMVIKRQFRIQKTPLDIPIALFLLSEVLSTIFSLDTHTSLWGYYSRFNGGLFSILSYVLLYYAFVSNLKEEEEKSTSAKEGFDIKRVYLFIGGVVVFIAGTLISSQIKTTVEAGIPFQMLATLVTALFSFALFMKAAPVGFIKRSIYAIFTSAFLVILWGLPSHFGYDPTCLLFRGTLDVACWTNDFQPKVRIFSTLGQPDWLAAYLAVLIPLIAGFFILETKKLAAQASKFSFKNSKFLIPGVYFVFFALSYLALLYTQSRSAIIAAWLIIPALLIWYFWFYVKPKFEKKKLSVDFKAAAIILLAVGFITFFAGQPFGQLEKFTLPGISTRLMAPAKPAAKTAPKPVAPQPAAPVTEFGGTDSGTIRKIVWQGAIDIWKNNPIFGSGLETYAFAYYQYRPAAHNLTSEWKFLYNKAHNEYLNYLATTGTFGIITYLSIIGVFLFITFRYLSQKRKNPPGNDFLIVAILAGYGTILITNFFGFSVVIINIFFYIIPAFVFILARLIDYDKTYKLSFSKKEFLILNNKQKIAIGLTGIIGVYLIYTLVNFWNADRSYYFGSNFDRSGDYQRAYPFLKTAISLRPSEPTFKDEYSYNVTVLGASVVDQIQKSTDKSKNQQNLQIAKQLIQEALNTSNQVVTEHPNNIVFWKTRVRVLYTLSQIDQSYLPQTLIAIKRAATLAPTDADVSYNLGILYGQNGDFKNAIKTLQNTIKLKVDYANAYYALAIFYHQLAVDPKGKIINEQYNKMATDELNLMIKLFGKNQQAEDAIKAWSSPAP